MSVNAVMPADATTFRCGVCGRYLTSSDGGYVRSAPCQCGWQTTVEAVGKRARQTVTVAGERIEVKVVR